MKARHTVLSIIFVSWIVSYTDRTAMTAAIPFIAADYHLTPLQMGMVLSAFAASNAIAQIPGGFLADRFGARRVAAGALLWWSAFTAITGTVASFAQMLVVRFAFGLGEGVFPAGSLKAIATWFPKAERATANAVKLAAQPLGGAIGVFVVGLLLSIWGWRAVFFALCIPGVLAAALFWKFVADDPSGTGRVSPGELADLDESDPAATEKPQGFSGLLKVLMHYNVWTYVLIYLLFSIADTGFNSWLPSYLVKARGFSILQMGAAAALPRLAAVAGCLVGGWMSDRFFSTRRIVPVIASQLLGALFLYLMFTADSKALLVLFQTLAGFCFFLFYSTFWAIPISAIPKQHIGVTSGFINTGGQIAAFLSPVAIGYLVGANHGNYSHAFGLLILSLLISCALVAVALARRTSSPEGPTAA